jgi:transcriptional regulator with XRE-family HTH domain
LRYNPNKINWFEEDSIMDNDREYMMIVGNNIRKYRKARKISQEELGRIIGRSGGWINKIERSGYGTKTAQIRRSIKLDEIHLIAKGLNIPVGWLTDKSDHTADISPFSRQDIDTPISEFYKHILVDAFDSMAADSNLHTIRIPSKMKDIDKLVSDIKALSPDEKSMLIVALGLVEENVEVTTKDGKEES